MVRYAQFSDLPCDPTPAESIQFEEEYRQIQGMLSIRSLNTKIQPFFEEYLEETAKIYSLATNGTHADFLLRHNRLRCRAQKEAITELGNLSEYLNYKAEEFKQLETTLKANLEEEFKNLVINIQTSLNKVYSQYRQILKNQFQSLKAQTEKQNKVIKIELRRLERELDIQSLKRRALNQGEMAQAARISQEQMQGYSVLFRTVTNGTLEELQNEDRARRERQISIDHAKIKKINCHQLWHLMELIKKKKEQTNNADAGGSRIFQTEDRFNTREVQRPTMIKKPEVLNSFEEQTFRVETSIINELSEVMSKKASKDAREGALNTSMNDSINASEKFLTDFFKDKHMKGLGRSIESKIQSEFVDFNRNFDYDRFLETQVERNRRPRQPEVEPQTQDNQNRNNQRFSVEPRYVQRIELIGQGREIQRNNESSERKNLRRRGPSLQNDDQRRQPSPQNFRKPNTVRPSPLIDGQRIDVPHAQDPQDRKKKEQMQYSFVRPGLVYNPNQRENSRPSSKDDALIKKLDDLRQNRMGSGQDRPLIAQRENFNQNSFSELHYDNKEQFMRSLARRRDDSIDQYNQYIQRMKKNHQYASDKERKQHEDQLSRQYIKKLQEQDERTLMQAHQKKLQQEQEFKREKERKQVEEKKQKERLAEKEKDYQEHLRRREIDKERQRQRQLSIQKEKERQKQQRKRKLQRQVKNELYEEIQKEREEKQRIKQREREKLRQRQLEEKKEREKSIERRQREEKERQRERQKQKSLQSLKQRQLEERRAAELQLKEFRELQALLKRKQDNKKFSKEDQPQPPKPKNIFTKDIESSKVAEEWRKERQRIKANKFQDDHQREQPKYFGRGNCIERQRTDNNFHEVVSDVDMDEQFLIMKQIQNNKHKLPKPNHNPMSKRFEDQANPSYGASFENDREYERPYRPNYQQEFGFGDHFREKQVRQQQADESLIQWAMNESLNEAEKKKKTGPLQLLKPVGKFIADTFHDVIVPNVKPTIERKLQETFDNTLIDFNQFLNGMDKKKQTFSLDENFKYDLNEIEAYEMFEVFEGGEEENVETKMVPISTCKSKGALNIKQIYQNAEDLHNTKDEDRGNNRPMTKLIVGDSTGNSVLISGIAVLYMNYVFEVKAGCCLKLDNCRLHKYSQSFEINHHRNINKAANIRDGSSIPKVDNNLKLSKITMPKEGKYIYEVKQFFNNTLSDCVNELVKKRITSGQILMRKPIIVTLCDVTKSIKQCIIGDYTGKIGADLSNLKKKIQINQNDTLIIRNAKIEIKKGAILLVADLTTVIIKADRGFRFSHDNRHIPDQLLRGNS